MTRWADDRRQRRDIAPNTWRAARSHIRSIVGHFGPATPIDSITETDLEEWLTLLAARVTARSRNTMCGTYRQFFAWAQRRGITTANPMAEIRNAKTAQQGPRLVPPPHVVTIVGHAELRARVLITVAAQLGLRRDELRQMHVEDWDRNARTLLVHGKGSKDRTVPVTGEPDWALTDWLDHRQRVRPPDAGPIRFGPMWPSARNPHHGLSGGSIYRIMTDASHQVGMHYTPHQYRHTTGTTMVLQGAPIEVVRRQLGHADLQSTSRYTFAAVDDIRPHIARVAYQPGSWRSRTGEP